MRFKKIKSTLYYSLFLLAFTLIAAEVLLRIYNPFPSSVVGDKIVLTRNYSRIFENSSISELDKRVVYKKNNLGFRGAEAPADFQDWLTIIAIGGSTTECTSISEGKTWEDHLGHTLDQSMNKTWVNNAGFDGHSTFGHQILLRDYIQYLNPKVCLFLIGVNDVNRSDPSADLNFTKSQTSWIIPLAKYSKLANVILNLYRNHLTKEQGRPPGLSKPGSQYLYLSDSTIQKTLMDSKKFLENYGKRLNEIVRLCRSNKIEPIFITQPTMTGFGIDSLTGFDFANCIITNKLNGKLHWDRLELYNDVTRRVGAETGTLVIDLAHKLPKNSAYFYDNLHYNNEGCIKVAEIVACDLVPYLQQKFEKYKKQ
jgi:hypothetical protein